MKSFDKTYFYHRLFLSSQPFNGYHTSKVNITTDSQNVTSLCLASMYQEAGHAELRPMFRNLLAVENCVSTASLLQQEDVELLGELR